jgi:hypothetical protein
MMKERPTKCIFKVNHIFRISVLLLHVSALQERHRQGAQSMLIKLCICYVIKCRISEGKEWITLYVLLADNTQTVLMWELFASVCCLPSSPSYSERFKSHSSQEQHLRYVHYRNVAGYIRHKEKRYSGPSGMGNYQATQPTAQSLPSPLPSPSEPIPIYKILQSDNSMQIADNKAACVETANSSVYSCDHPKDHEGASNTSPLVCATHRAMPEFCY